MTVETLALSDAPEPIETDVETTVADAEVVETEEVKDEQQTPEVSDSSTETVEEKKPDPVQKRIDELTRKRRDAERDAEYWRQQAQKQPEKPVEEVKPEPLKTLADFDYDESKYQSHLFGKAQEGAVESARQVLKEEQSQQSASRKISDFRGREAEFSKDVDDYHEVVQNRDLRINQVMADVATEMDGGPEVLYYLGKNPDLADKISQLSPLSAAREMGRLEAKIQSQEKSGKQVSEAPAPAPKLTAVEPSITKSLDELEQRDFNKARRDYIANKRGR